MMHEEDAERVKSFARGCTSLPFQDVKKVLRRDGADIYAMTFPEGKMYYYGIPIYLIVDGDDIRKSTAQESFEIMDLLAKI